MSYSTNRKMFLFSYMDEKRIVIDEVWGLRMTEGARIFFLFLMMTTKNILRPSMTALNDSTQWQQQPRQSISGEAKALPGPCTLQIGKRFVPLAGLGFCVFSYRLPMRFHPWQKDQSVCQMSSPSCKVQGAKEQVTQRLSKFLCIFLILAHIF